MITDVVRHPELFEAYPELKNITSRSILKVSIGGIWRCSRIPARSAKWVPVGKFKAERQARHYGAAPTRESEIRRLERLSSKAEKGYLSKNKHG